MAQLRNTEPLAQSLKHVGKEVRRSQEEIIKNLSPNDSALDTGPQAPTGEVQQFTVSWYQAPCRGFFAYKTGEHCPPLRCAVRIASQTRSKFLHLSPDVE